MRRIFRLIFVFCLVTGASSVLAGTWGALPDAIARLQVNPNDRAAEGVIADAEASILNEIAAGRLPAVVTLMEVYASLVMRLPSGEQRIQSLQRRAAAALVIHGNQQKASDLDEAGRSWTLAASFDPSSEAVELLRGLIFPPAEPETGETWISELDGAALVYLPPTRVRIGCSELDRRCRQNEVFFLWLEVPGIWVETTEVTNDRYRRCVASGGCSLPANEEVFNDRSVGSRPVVGVTWLQARDFARWTGRSLPTEAEWERAARGDSTRRRFPWGSARRPDAANVLSDALSYGGGPMDVGSFEANPEGIHDLAGNVWEWCEDRYQPGLKDLPSDGSPRKSGIGRVVRGGSWRRTIDLARVSTRSWFDDDYRADDLGFRCFSQQTGNLSDARVISTARRTFPIEIEPGRELFGVRLSAEDRRYLEQRTITWLVLEERSGEAVLQAENLLRRDPRDPAAIELLDWVETELAKRAQAGDVTVFAELQISYRRVISSHPQFGRRARDSDVRLAAALRACGERYSRDGNRERARACFQEGLRIASGDPVLRRGLEALENRAGEFRIWSGDGKQMSWVPGDTFRFGASPGDRQAATDELPSSEIRVDGFWMDRTEVTNEEYRRCVDAGACTPPNRPEVFDDPMRKNHPVLWVSWLQARSYADWAGKRLPTEVEWERAARAGSTTRYPWGNSWDSSRANGLGIEGNDRWVQDAPVGSFPANVWGIHDLIGNAAEYVLDVYHLSYDGLPRTGRPWVQETGSFSERQRVIRGGSWADQASRHRVSRRASRVEMDTHRATGFRCVVD